MRLALRRFVAAPFSVIASEGIATLNRHPRRAVYVHTVQKQLARQPQDQNGNFFMSLLHLLLFQVTAQKHHNTHQLLEVASIKSRTKSCERETRPFELQGCYLNSVSPTFFLYNFCVQTLVFILLSQSALFHRRATICSMSRGLVTSRLCFWKHFGYK